MRYISGDKRSCQTRYVRFKFPAVINRPTNTGFPHICLGTGALTSLNVLQYNGVYFNSLHTCVVARFGTALPSSDEGAKSLYLDYFRVTTTEKT